MRFDPYVTARITTNTNKKIECNSVLQMKYSFLEMKCKGISVNKFDCV